MKRKMVRQWLINYYNGGMNIDQIEEKIFHLFDENTEGVSTSSRTESKEDCNEKGIRHHLVGLSTICINCGKDLNNLVES